MTRFMTITYKLENGTEGTITKTREEQRMRTLISQITDYQNIVSIKIENGTERKDGTERIERQSFVDLKKLKSVRIPNSITNIDERAFRDCESLTDLLDIDGKKTYLYHLTKLKSIESQVFEGCTNLKKVNIPISVTSIKDYAFRYCEELEECNIGEGWNLESIGDQAFVNCHKLKKLFLPNKLKSIGKWAFWECYALKELNIPNSVNDLHIEAFGYSHIKTIITTSDNKAGLIEGKKYYGKTDSDESYSSIYEIEVKFSNAPIPVMLGSKGGGGGGKKVVNLTVTSIYNTSTRKVKYTFKLNKKPSEKFQVKYAFKKIFGYNKMSLPSGYQNLTFGKNVQEISKEFSVKSDVTLNFDLNLIIRIKEIKNKSYRLLRINNQKFEPIGYDYSATINKDKGKGNSGNGINKDPVGINKDPGKKPSGNDGVDKGSSNKIITNVTLDENNSSNTKLKIIFKKEDTNAMRLKYKFKNNKYFVYYSADTIEFDTGETETHNFIDIKSDITPPNNDVNLTFLIGLNENEKTVKIPKKYFEKDINLTITFEHKSSSKKIKYNFELNKKPSADSKIEYAFVKNSPAYNYIADPHQNYKKLNFKDKKSIIQEFNIKKNATISTNLELQIKIKPIRALNGLKYKNINGTQVNNNGNIYTATILEDYNIQTETEGRELDYYTDKSLLLDTLVNNKNVRIGINALKVAKNKIQHTTAVGSHTLNSLSIGAGNTALGAKSMMLSAGKVNYNTAIGNMSLLRTNGEFNVALGFESEKNIPKGKGNILLGKGTSSSNNNSLNEIVIGNDAKGVENSIVVGNENITSIEPGKTNFTTLGTKLNKANTTFISEISNGEVTIKLPNKKLTPGMLMLDASGNLTTGNLKNEIAANSSKGNTIFIEVNAGNINGINNNPKVFYKFDAYAYNEVTNKKGKKLDWNGKLDVSKTYIFGRKDNVRVHPFYISDVGYKKKPNKVTITNIVGKGMNYNLGIKGDQRIKLEFKTLNAHDKLYYYCTAHKNMIGEFELFSSDWYKLIVTPRSGLEPGTDLTIKSKDKNGNPLKGNQYIFDKNNKVIGKNIVYELALDRRVPEGKSVILEYKTLDNQGSAVVGKDFKSTQGTVTFTEGTDPDTGIKDGKGKFQDIVVPVLDDADYEDDKEVRMRFKDNNKVITNSDKGYIYSNAKIQDFDTNPVNERYELTVDNPSAVEGKILKYTLTLNKKAASDILVQYAVVKNVSTLKHDTYTLPYYKSSLSVEFKKGSTKAELRIPTIKDGIYDNENKKLVLQFTSYFLNFKNQPPVKVRATGTVTEADENPANMKYSVERISAPEKTTAPNNKEGSLLFVQIRLNKDPLTDIKVNVKTEDNTAKAGTHYTTYNKTITFKKGIPEKNIEIQTKSDNEYTGQSKTFKIILSSDNFNQKFEQTCIINEGDANPQEKRYYLVAQKSPEIDESDSGTEDLKFVVKLANNERANRDITINYKTLDNYDDNDRATAGTDYISAKGTLTINQGNKTGAIYVKVKGDTDYENNEYVYLEFSPVDGTIDTISNTLLMSGYIWNDDTNPDDYIYKNATTNSPEVTEANTKMKFNVDLGEKAKSKITINYRTLDDKSTATPGKNKDYVSKSGQIIFNKDERYSDFEITIKDDTDFEAKEKIVLELSGDKINTFRAEGYIKPDSDADPNSAKPNLTTNETSYNHDNGELSIKLTNTGSRDVIVNDNTQFNSLFEATTNSGEKVGGTSGININGTTYYVKDKGSDKNNDYLDIEFQNYDTYFNNNWGINVNNYYILPSAPAYNSIYAITNEPGLKAGESIEFKIKGSFQKGKTYIISADDVKYNDVNELNETDNYFKFTPTKTITYTAPTVEQEQEAEAEASPTIAGYSYVEQTRTDISRYDDNGSGYSWIGIYLTHYDGDGNENLAIKSIQDRTELLENWKFIVAGEVYTMTDISATGSNAYRNDYYWYFGVDPRYTGGDYETVYWYKKN